MNARRLHRVLLGAVAAACGGLTTEGESSTTASGPHRDTDRARAADPVVDASEPDVIDGAIMDAGALTRPFDCNSQEGYPLLRAALGVDYLEQRHGTPASWPYPDAGATWAVTASNGTKCETATSKPRCQAALSEASSNVYLFGECGGCMPGGEYFAYTGGNTVGTIATVADLVALGGGIDSAAEAWVVALANRYSPACDREWALVRSDGIVVRATKMISDCPVQTKDVDLLVRRDGSIEELSVVVHPPTSACVGRRPAGLLARRRNVRGSPLGAHFAEIARLEAAAVCSFEALRSELAAHGAPRRLLRGCARAARDEIAHARMTAKLARRYGGTVERPRVEGGEPRSLLAIALENATEGCVRETYGAAEGLFRARTAGDARVRAVMKTIAPDEARHASLSWRIAEWIDTRLGSTERAAVREARATAIDVLMRELEQAPDPSIVTVAGAPMPTQARILVGALRRSVWSET
jgi:hypothetical protein